MGSINRDGLKTLRAYFPETTLIIDAGIGAPSQAAEAMELGYDAVLLNTAVAKASDPVKMAQAFARAIEAGAARLRGRADRAARHGVAIDAGRRHPLLQDRPRLLSAGRLDPFYPILPDAAWVARIAGQGAKFIQLRVKHAEPAAIKTEIARALAVASAQGCQLVVNDYWREAIDLGADFVHLGQGDLAGADLDTIRSAGIKLGISTHSLAELDNALGRRARLRGARAHLPDQAEGDALAAARSCPHRRMASRGSLVQLVAIGGITLERAPEVLAAGATSAAVVTDIVMSDDPERRTRDWIAATAPWRDLSTAYPPA